MTDGNPIGIKDEDEEDYSRHAGIIKRRLLNKVGRVRRGGASPGSSRQLDKPL